MKKFFAPALLICLVGIVTLILQAWVGRPLIYSKPDKVRTMHQALLADVPPPGKTWSELGINGGSARRGALELAELGHQATGVDIPHVYFGLDTLFLFVAIALLWLWLRRWVPPIYALIGVLYFAAVAPLTYLFFYFHPWDRISTCCWLVALLALERRQLPLLLAAVAAGMYVKFDMIFLPFFYAAITWKDGGWQGRLLRTAGVGALIWGIWVWLMWQHPIEKPPGEPTDLVIRRLGDIAGDLRTFAVAWPPLLFLSLPLALLVSSWRRQARFHRWALAFVLCTLAFYAVTVNLREVRAHVPLLCLLLPGALVGLRALLEAAEAGEPDTSTPAA